MHTDVVIIGGGISGLISALHCISAGYKCVVLEKSTRFGGRIHTVYHKNWKYEAGAGRVGRYHHRTLELLRRFGMTLSETSMERQYRDVEHPVPQKSPAVPLLKKVLDAAGAIKKNKLQQMTFGMLCYQVLGQTNMNRLVGSFGYDCEFENMNAWDGIEMFQRHFTDENVYYTCNEGLETWVQRIVTEIQNSNAASLLAGFQAYKWKRKSDGNITVSTRSSDGTSVVMSCKAVVCAIPKRDLLDTFEWTPFQQTLLDSVEEIPLHRIFGKFPTKSSPVWFSNIPASTTNANIRQFSPVSKQHGVAMVSYTDNKNAVLWQNYANMGDSSLRTALLEQLHVVFPEIPHIPSPSWVHSHFWNNGIHMWKPGFDSQAVSKKLVQPYGKDIPVFLVGESYSRHQAWIEGALETVEDAIPLMFKMLSKEKHLRNTNTKTNEKSANTKKSGMK